jgi:hypothetical protein
MYPTHSAIDPAVVSLNIVGKSATCLKIGICVGDSSQTCGGLTYLQVMPVAGDRGASASAPYPQGRQGELVFDEALTCRLMRYF